MDILTVTGIAALVYAISSSQKAKETISDLKKSLTDKIDNQQTYFENKIEEGDKKYDVTEYIKCTSVYVSLKNIVDKYWNAEFSVTFHNSDVIPLKVTKIRCQVYINGVGLTMFTAGTDNTFTIAPKSDYSIQLSGHNSLVFVPTKGDREKIRDAFNKKGSTVSANANVGYVLLATASDTENHQQDTQVLGVAKYNGAGLVKATGQNYGPW